MKINQYDKWLTFTLIFLLIVAAIILRIPGFDGRALWIDELWRVNLILDKDTLARYWNAPDVYTAITAPLYLGVNHVLGWIKPAPSILRFSSFIPAIISVVLVFLVAKRARAELLVGFSVALLFSANTYFIQYSNEFKPYMYEVLVHLVCLYLWFDLLSSKVSTRRQWIVFCFAMIVASLSAANIVFVLPAMAISLFDKTYKFERDKLKIVISVFLVVAVVVVMLYFLIWSYGSNKDLINYWSKGFYSSGEENYFKFAVSRIFGIWKGAFSVIGVKKYLIAISLLVSIYSAYLIVRKDNLTEPLRGTLIYCFSLILTLLILNAMGLWPLGEFRPNLFLYSIFIVLWLLLLNELLPRMSQRFVGVLIICVTVFCIFSTNYQTYKGLGAPIEQTDRVWHSFSKNSTIGKLVLEECKSHPVEVFTNPGMTMATHYFSKYLYRNEKNNVLVDECVNIIPAPDAYANPAKLQKLIMNARISSGLVWFAYSHLNQDEIEKLKIVAKNLGSLKHQTSYDGAGYFAVLVNN